MRREVPHGRSLSNSAHLVVNRPVADADPSSVGAEIWDRDAAQMGADGRADQDCVVGALFEVSASGLVQEGAGGESLLILDLLLGESSDEGGDSVPGDLDDLA